MTEISATEAARNFANLLDAVEHNGERVLIARRGKVVAQIEPVAKGRGSELKFLLKRHALDAQWSNEVKELRELIVPENRF